MGKLRKINSRTDEKWFELVTIVLSGDRKAGV